MKVAVVPAQVTTVEDRIAGNLGLSQLLLLTAPVFGGSALYVALPPTFHSAAYKLAVMATLALVCSVLAIRIKGKIILLWLVVLLRYNLRPRYYVFDKRSLHGREKFESLETKLEAESEAKPTQARESSPLSLAEVIKLEHIMENPAANLSFETRKGGLYVRITEVKQEG